MFGSVRLPGLLAVLASSAFFCGLLSLPTASGVAQVLAQNTSQPESEAGPAPERRPEPAPAADRAKTEAALQTLQQAAQADAQAADEQAAKEQAAARGSTEAMPLATELQAEAHAMREHLKKMRRLAIQYHLSETPADTRRLRGEWLKLLTSGRKVHQQMVEGAMRDYRAHPDPKSPTADFLYQVAGRNADADRFDGMLEVVKLLKETGYSVERFDLCFGLTAGAHNEFELAHPHLQAAIKRLEKDGSELAADENVDDQQRQAMLKKMSDTHALLSELSDYESYRPLWEEELKRREADAQGEPLPRVLIETTKGAVEIELFENDAPNTVANFIALCEQDFYDGLPFHRVLTHFMAQGGCPNRDGSGGPGYTIPSELGEDPRNFFRGTLGMALSGHPDTGGSQFFICYMPRAYLNGKYVAFGRVVEGMNVLSDLVHIDPEEKSAEGEMASDEPDEIISTKVLRKRDHPYVPKKMPQAK